MTYVEPKISEERNNKKRIRKRKIIWFSPPYSKNVKTNIDKIFSKSLHKHFLPSHSFDKIFNKKSFKISDSCMRSMSSIIPAYNCSTLNPLKRSFGCNCHSRSMCPLQNKCLTPNIVYQAEITNTVDDEKRVYLGLSETPF